MCGKVVRVLMMIIIIIINKDDRTICDTVEALSSLPGTRGSTSHTLTHSVLRTSLGKVGCRYY